MADVGRSIDWYVATLGFAADPFPPQPPGSVRRSAPLVRAPERMFDGLVEFDVVDPDGHRICVSGALPADADVPAARERDGDSRARVKGPVLLEESS